MDHEAQLLGNETSPLIQSVTDDYLSARPPSFIRSARTGSRDYKPSIRNRISLWFTQSFSFIVSSFFLGLVVGWALLASFPTLIRDYRKDKEVFEWDNHEKYKNEKNTQDVRYYAREVGFDIVDEEVETEDGFLLRYVIHWDLLLHVLKRIYIRVHRIVNPRHKRNGASQKGMYNLCHLHTTWASHWLLTGGYPVLLLHGKFTFVILC